MEKLAVIFVMAHAIGLSGVAFASSDYHGTVGVEYSDYRTDQLTRRQTSLGTNVYLVPVQRKLHPWNEAGFLEHASSLSADFSHFDDSTTFSYDQGGHQYSLGGLFASKSFPLTGDVTYHRFRLKNDSITINHYGVDGRLGAYVIKPLRIMAHYYKVNYTYDPSENLIYFTNTTSYGLQVKYVLEFRNQAVSIEDKMDWFKRGSSNTNLLEEYSWSQRDLTVKYFPTRKFALVAEGVAIAYDHDYGSATSFVAGVEGLLFNRLSISLKYESHTTEKTVFIDSDHTQWVGAVQLWF